MADAADPAFELALGDGVVELADVSIAALRVAGGMVRIAAVNASSPFQAIRNEPIPAISGCSSRS